MIVGAWPAPNAVLIFVLKASFWNVGEGDLAPGVRSVEALDGVLADALVRLSAEEPEGGASPPPPPPPAPPPAPVCVGPELLHAAKAPASGAAAARARKVRREVVLGSTLISVLEGPRRSAAGEVRRVTNVAGAGVYFARPWSAPGKRMALLDHDRLA
jgi:hypothetical protein